MFKIIAFLQSFSMLSSIAFASGDGNTIQVINHGVAAFEKRLEMIDRAEQSIDVEYFIYNTDQAGRLFSQALVKKKLQNPNIKIRILVDASSTVLQLKKNYISEFAKYGIEVRYYNQISLLHFEKAQFRDHRKLIVIDENEAITGSRNIADEYFDLSSEFNFRDRDIWVSGPIVHEMKTSFEKYWANDRTTPGPRLGVIDTDQKAKDQIKAHDFLTETNRDIRFRVAIRNTSKQLLNNPDSFGSCENLTYVTDEPGYQRAHTRRVLPHLFGRMNDMKSGETLYVESPYFIVHDQNAKEQLAFLKEKNIKGVLLTNSLASTDAFYVAANFYPNSSFYQSMVDSKMYVFDGNTPKDTPFIHYTNGHSINEKAVWGIHSKTFVFSNDAFAIGTFNVDPRSANLNSEMMLFCEGGKKMTQFVLNDIKSRISQSDLLGRDGNLVNGKSLTDHVSFLKKIKFKLSIYPSEWFSYLL